MNTLKMNPARVSATRPAAATRMSAVICQATNPNTEHRKIDLPMVALQIALSAGLILSPAAFADEDGAPLTPYEQRQLEMQRRRDLLRQAREKAEQNNQESTAAATAQADADVEASNESRRVDTPRKLNIQAYDQQAAKALKAPAANPYENSPLNFSLPPPPEKLSDIKVPEIKVPESFKGFTFEAPKFEMPKFDAPEPAPEQAAPPPPPPPAPAPRPAPVVRAAPPPPPAPVVKAPVVKAEPVKAAPAKAAAETKPGKRKGPLPLAVAELLVIGLLGGVGVALTKYNEQTNKALSAAGKVIVSGYNKLEEAVAAKK